MSLPTIQEKVRDIFTAYLIQNKHRKTPERFAILPQKIIKDSPVSLWNVALEIHTGRIYQSIIGDFYVLIVPITGIFALFILISGFIVWLKIRKKVNY